jgi:preprotein translocase subunit YajC
MSAAAAPILVLVAVLLAVQLLGRRRRVETQRALVAQLVPGDEVITSGGLIGRVVEVVQQDQREVRVEVAPGTVVRVAAPAIIGRPPAPTPSVTPPPAPATASEDAD